MEWRRLTQPEEPAFGRAMALYEASFPRHEQRLPDEQRAVLSHPEYHFIQLFDGAEFVGLLLYWEAEDFRYVEHFCVRPEAAGLLPEVRLRRQPLSPRPSPLPAGVPGP